MYQQALNGTLVSKAGPVINGVIFENKTEVPLNIYWIDYFGMHETCTSNGFPNIIQPGATSNSWQSYVGHYFLFTTVFSGAFVCVVQLVSGQTTYAVTCDMVIQPNDIGSFPQPTVTTLIPTDSPRILIGCGRAPNGNPVTREQYWMRSGDSHTLAPKEKRTVGYTTTTGMQQTTSQQTTVSESMGLSASGGWGPISASVSSSISTTSSRFQQLTVSSEMTRYESMELTNTGDQPQMFLKWQLTDIVTVFSNQNGQPLSGIVVAQSPMLIAGPYNPKDLPALPPKPEISAEIRAKRPTPPRLVKISGTATKKRRHAVNDAVIGKAKQR